MLLSLPLHHRRICRSMGFRCSPPCINRSQPCLQTGESGTFRSGVRRRVCEQDDHRRRILRPLGAEPSKDRHKLFS